MRWWLLLLLSERQSVFCRATCTCRHVASLVSTQEHGQPTRSTRRSGRVPPGPAISNALKVRSLLLPGVQDPSNQVDYKSIAFVAVTQCTHASLAQDTAHCMLCSSHVL
jgi:hypothetical protein